MLVRARAPLRLGLAGGGTDVSPYCERFGGLVLNATIDRYAYAVIKELDEPVVRFMATDQLLCYEYEPNDFYNLDGNLNLHKAVYNEIIGNYNNGQAVHIELATFCDAPVGSGLGSSSTVVVAMLRAFVEFFNLPLDDYAIAQMAFKIERLQCGFAGGRQDQYSATFGGFNFMEFYGGERTVINPLRIKNWIVCELEASLLLFYTGVSRESARIISEQSQNMKKSDAEILEPFHGLKREAIMMKECLLKGDFEGIVASMREGWENKKISAGSVSNTNIDKLYEAAINSGAKAGKVSGAGGGGFMIFFVSPDRRMDVIRTLKGFEGEVSGVNFTKDGARAWKIL